MELKTTVTAKKMLEMSGATPFAKKIIQKMVSFLQNFFGSEILLDVPVDLQDVNEEIFPVLKIAEQLKLLGILERVRKIERTFPDEPYFFRYFSYLGGKVVGGGADFISEKRALYKSLGEEVERYFWGRTDYFFRGKIKKASYLEVKENALDIFSLTGFSAEQRKEFEILQFDEKTNFEWILVNSFTNQKQAFCPVQLLSVFYARNHAKTPQSPKKEEAMLRWRISTGVAAGQSLEHALLGGILELIERDAFMITYLNMIAPPQYDHESLSEDEDVAKILAKFRQYNLEVGLFNLPSDFSIFITMAVIIDRSGAGPAVIVASSADFNLKNSILDALSECLAVRVSVRIRWDKNKKVKRIDQEGRLIYWANEDNRSKLDFLFQGETEEVDWNEHRNFFSSDQSEKTKEDCQKELDILKKEFSEKKYKLLWKKISSPEVEKLGFYVVSTVSPDLQPLHLEEEIPYWSGKRLSEVPRKLGYQSAEKINQVPNPFP
ncbi:MAG: YcaO-like family protein [Candidatus Moraniibacteriota bacterium]